MTYIVVLITVSLTYTHVVCYRACNIMKYNMKLTNVNIVRGEPERVLLHDGMHAIVLYRTLSECPGTLSA